MLSHQFHISESYLSHLFKEKTGENLSNYLETLRLNEAANRLTHPETDRKRNKQSINSLYMEVGYNSAVTFRRAFKKRFGITPSEMAGGRQSEEPIGLPHKRTLHKPIAFEGFLFAERKHGALIVYAPEDSGCSLVQKNGETPRGRVSQPAFYPRAVPAATPVYPSVSRLRTDCISTVTASPINRR